jgi:5-(carboxyamino)imidazole ribonucleotide mutase
MNPPVAIVMGSQSDWATMKGAADVLAKLGVETDVRIVSAHRTPERLFDFARGAADEGFKVVIAGAGGAAHLPGMVASLTHLPVLGVPVQSKALSGQDSLLSIVQMPAGIPVGTLAIGEAGAVNAGLLAAAILATNDPALTERLKAFRAAQTDAVAQRPSGRDDSTRRDNRHSGRRPAWPDDRHGGGPTGLPLPCLCARSGFGGGRGLRRIHPCGL